MIKYINFLSTPSHNHHKKINRWYLMSCSSIIALLASLSMISARQIQQWHSIHKEQQKLKTVTQKADDFVAKHEQLTKEKASLLKKTEEWEKYTHRSKKPSDMLSAIKNNTEQHKITSLRMVRRSVRFQMNVHNAQEGMKVSQQLASTAVFSEVKLTSFKSIDRGIDAIIEGTIAA